MTEPQKSRLRKLMYHVVPDPDGDITDDVLAKLESVDREELEKLKAEFRSILESLDEYPSVRRTVLAALEFLEASSHAAMGSGIEWMDLRDIMGRRIRKAMAEVL